MLAAAVASHGGVVMWRAFVYDMKEGYDRDFTAAVNISLDSSIMSWISLASKPGKSR